MNVTTINTLNLDEWLFEHFEGNLVPAEETLLQDYISAHPELKPEVEVWGNSFISEAEMAWPGEAAFLESQALKSSFWNQWTISLNVLLVGLSVGAVIYFSSGNEQAPQSPSFIEESALSPIGTQKDDLTILMEENMTAIPGWNDLDIEWNVGLPDDQRITNYNQEDNQKAALKRKEELRNTDQKSMNLSPQMDLEKVQEGAKEPDHNGPGANDPFMTQFNNVDSEVQDQANMPKVITESDLEKQGNQEPIKSSVATSHSDISKEKTTEKTPENRKIKRDKRKEKKGNFVPIHSDPF